MMVKRNTNYVIMCEKDLLVQVIPCFWNLLKISYFLLFNTQKSVFIYGKSLLKIIVWISCDWKFIIEPLEVIEMNLSRLTWLGFVWFDVSKNHIIYIFFSYKTIQQTFTLSYKTLQIPNTLSKTSQMLSHCILDSNCMVLELRIISITSRSICWIHRYWIHILILDLRLM